MRIAIYTVDLYEGREFLMPWRTVLEMAQKMAIKGHKVIVINGCSGVVKTSIFQSDNNMAILPRIDYEWRGVRIKAIKSGYKALALVVEEIKADVLYTQITWRDGLRNLSPLKKLNCKKIAYFSGGIFELGSALMLANRWGIKEAKPYLIESLMPKFLLVNKLKRIAVEYLLGFTPYTTECVKKAGFFNSRTIVTGKDAFEVIVPDSSILEKYNLKGKKFMLFSGAPSPTRGACEVLRALDKVCIDDICIVMLMRTDVGSDYTNFNRVYEQMMHKDRVMIIKEKITREQLRAFFGAAYFSLLPFIVVPSEIPVTYLEVLSCGTPIITFPNGGTTKYLKSGLLVSSKSISGLANTLQEGWINEDKRKQLSDAALILMSKHPTWEEVTTQMLDLIG